YGQAGLAALPATADEAEAWYLLVPGHLDVLPDAVRAVLLREMLGLLALGRAYLCSTPFPEYKSMLAALGFDRVAGGRYRRFAKGERMDGYVLDLSRIGVEPWIEAIISGRRPPKVLALPVVEAAVQAALTHWADDAHLARSPLVGLPNVPP